MTDILILTKNKLQIALVAVALFVTAYVVINVKESSTEEIKKTFKITYKDGSKEIATFPFVVIFKKGAIYSSSKKIRTGVLEIKELK